MTTAPMTSPGSPRLPDASSRGGSEPSLEDRIRTAEQAVVARDLRFRDRTQQLSVHARRVRAEATQKLGKGLTIAAAGAAAVAAFLWMRPKPKPAPAYRAGGAHGHALHEGQRHAASRAAAAKAARRSAGKPRSRFRMARLAAFVIWPLLPVRMRTQWSPAMATALMFAGLPSQLARAGTSAEPDTVAEVDLQRYSGLWYEIARLPIRQEKKCVGDVTASYVFSGDAFTVVNRCRLEDGSIEEMVGVARTVPNAGGTKLQVSFAPEWLHFLPFVWSDYWVLQLAADYSVALVGTPDRSSLWLLSRSPDMDDAEVQRYIARAQAQGYDTSSMLRTAHS